MTDLVTWITDLFGVSLGTIGTTDITLGIITAFSLVSGLVLTFFRRVKGRG